MLICLFLHFKLKYKSLYIILNVIRGLKPKLIKLNQVTIKINLIIFLLRGPHLHARGAQKFLLRAAFESNKLRARRPQIFSSRAAVCLPLF